jgi:methyl-accepting chemotaxis protein
METIMNTCWEFLTCGVIEDCPAYPDHGYDCWTVEGTLCGGERQGAYEDKIGDCRGGVGKKCCEYYQAAMTGSR